MGFVPRRIVMWEVIVRSRAWMRRTVDVRVVSWGWVGFEEDAAGNEVVVVAGIRPSSTGLTDLSSTGAKSVSPYLEVVWMIVGGL